MRMMRRSTTLLATVSTLAVLAACLRTLPHSAEAEGVALAAAPTLQMAPHDGRAHWLLRQEPGWVGAYRVDFGGREEDRAYTIVRVGLFTDETAAGAAFARLTPEYAQKLWRRRMRETPHDVTYPFTIAGDEVRTMEYPLHVDPRDEGDSDEELIVQLIALRAGRAVMVVESIGIPRDELPQVIAILVRTAAGLPPAGE